VELINIGHKGIEFIFGNLADASQSWAYVFARNTPKAKQI
jgi:CNT family concentrative nucleoside transporter